MWSSSLDILVLVLIIDGDIGAAGLQLALDGLPELLLVHRERQVQLRRVVLLA